MANDRVAADTRDKRMRSRAQRRAKFATRKGWRVSQALGTPYLNTEGYHLIIAKKADGRYQVGAKSPIDQRHLWGQRRFDTIEAAKTGCFDALEFMKQEYARRTAKRQGEDRD
ncbi:hypothetical protein [Sphingomonas sp. PB4P5]|uniref:hypothetical protein n=1 Tax=Parasphingomonas puruogangriensis TaxID=3096155 RepID=UPI002FC6FC70